MIRKVIVIKADDLEQANELCNQVGAMGQTFSACLYNENNELSNYACNWLMHDSQYEAIKEDPMFLFFDTLDEALIALDLHRESGEN